MDDEAISNSLIYIKARLFPPPFGSEPSGSKTKGGVAMTVIGVFRQSPILSSQRN
jgi:hypothetical protein